MDALLNGWWFWPLMFLAGYLGTTFRLVKRPNKWVVELNLKKVTFQVWEPGIHFHWLPQPFMRIANQLFCADLPTEITIGKQDGKPGNPSKVEFTDTSAGVTVQLTTRVIDPIRATYEVEDYLLSSINIVEAQLRQYFANMTLDEAMKAETRVEAVQEMMLHLKEPLADWGVKVVNVSIIDFDLPEGVVEQRDKVLAAEKGKQATITEAEGKAQAAILIANAEGQAEWSKIKAIARNLKLEPTQVIAYLLTGRMTDALQSSTIILSSGQGGINLPHIDMAAAMAAVQQAMNKKEN